MDGSMFPNIHLPGGISAEAAKYREMAREGNEWRSPVFDIGSSKASSSIPSPKKITRKSPHKHSRAAINERTQSQGNEQIAGGFTSLNARRQDGADPTRTNIYQPRMSTATDSMRTAVDHDDFGTENLGKHNAAVSQLDRDVMTSP